MEWAWEGYINDNNNQKTTMLSSLITGVTTLCTYKSLSITYSKMISVKMIHTVQRITNLDNSFHSQHMPC